MKQKEKKKQKIPINSTFCPRHPRKFGSPTHLNVLEHLRWQIIDGIPTQVQILELGQVQKQSRVQLIDGVVRQVQRFETLELKLKKKKNVEKYRNTKEHFSWFAIFNLSKNVLNKNENWRGAA